MSECIDNTWNSTWKYFESLNGFKEHCDNLVKDQCFSCVVMIQTFVDKLMENKKCEFENCNNDAEIRVCYEHIYEY